MNASAHVTTLSHNTGVAQSMHEAIDHAASSAHSAVDKAVAAANCAGAWLSDRGGQVKVLPNELIEKSTGYVHANPLKAIGIALAVGLLLSRISR